MHFVYAKLNNSRKDMIRFRSTTVKRENSNTTLCRVSENAKREYF